MGLPSGLRSIVVAASLGIAGSASAAEVQSTCTGDEISNGVTQLAAAIDQAAAASTRFMKGSRSLDRARLDGYQPPAFAGTGTDQGPTSTTYDVKSAHESEGASGVVPTVSWTPAEQTEISSIENKLPVCLSNLAGIKEQYRVQRGLKTAKSGILGIAYSYNNQQGVTGGRLVMTDLMFNGQVYKGLTGDQQMQAALGYRACYPPSGDPNSPENVKARVAAMPPEIKKLTRERILFHEYIHGATHEQEGDDWANGSSTEGFFEKPSPMCATCGASRFDALRAKLFAPGATTPESQTIAGIKKEMAAISPVDPAARQKYCALYGQLSDFMKAQGVPQRWPGDMHALDDKDEYITILIENAVYDPKATFGTTSAYSPAEQQWVKDWWSNTFGAGTKLGECQSLVAKAPAVDKAGAKSNVANAYSDDLWYSLGWFGGF